MEMMIATSFVVVAVLTFMCQIYVAYTLYQSQQAPRLVTAVFHGSRTFVRGWQQAEPLGLTKVMTVWSILTAALMIALCVIATILTR